MKDKKPSEDIEQIKFVSWFRINYPEVRIFAIPNGGHRHIAVAHKLRLSGVSKGVPDLMIPEWKMWIEMKRQDGGTVSKEQKEWMEYLERCGYLCHVCNGFEEAKEVIHSL